MLRKVPIFYLLPLMALLAWLVVGGVRVGAASTVTITSPTANQALTAGSFTVIGTAMAGKTVTVKVDGNSVGTTLATGGSWSMNINGIADGNHSLSAEVDDGPMAYFTSFVSNLVSVVDTNTNTVAQTINVPSGALGVAYKPDGSKVYVTGYMTSNNVSVIDTATNVVEATIAVGNTPLGIAVNPAGTKAYVVNSNSNSVSVVNLANNTVSSNIGVGTSPFGVVFSPDGTKAYVSNLDSDDVTVINATNDTVTTTIALSGEPKGIDINSDGSRVYVAISPNNVEVINATNNTALSIITVCDNVQNLSHSKPINRLVVACHDYNEIAVYDTTADTNTQIGGNLVLADGPFGIDFSRLDSNIAYVTEGGQGAGNKVYRVDITGPTLLGDFTVGDAPASMGRFILPSTVASATVNFSVVASGEGSTNSPVLPAVGALWLLTAPLLLAFLVTFAYIVWDWRRHLRPLREQDPHVHYALSHHIKYVTVATINYKLGLHHKRLPLIPTNAGDRKSP